MFICLFEHVFLYLRCSFTCSSLKDVRRERLRHPSEEGRLKVKLHECFSRIKSDLKPNTLSLWNKLCLHNNIPATLAQCWETFELSLTPPPQRLIKFILVFKCFIFIIYFLIYSFFHFHAPTLMWLHSSFISSTNNLTRLICSVTYTFTVSVISPTSIVPCKAKKMVRVSIHT